MVEPGSPLCPTCAYDPHTGDTALNPPRTETGDAEPSTLSVVVSGLSMLLAIGLVVFAAVYAFNSIVVERPATTRTFATESNGSPTTTR
ncbi:MAG: hypothetical protein HYX32_08245 [Actinobacteria bacterium]|nr:hypothetical protein [Actinomycetota bacterium]